MNIPDRTRFLMAAALISPFVAGCDRKPDERSKAAGEVLQGTISDAMIAPDRVRSEPPIAPRKEGPSDAKGEKAKPRSSAGPEVIESPAPESSPAPQASPAPETPSSEPAG